MYMYIYIYIWIYRKLRKEYVLNQLISLVPYLSIEPCDQKDMCKWTPDRTNPHNLRGFTVTANGCY